MGHGLYVCLTASINMQERVDALAAGEGDGSNSSSSSDDESSSSSSSHFGLQSSAAPKAKPSRPVFPGTIPCHGAVHDLQDLGLVRVAQLGHA